MKNKDNSNFLSFRRWAGILGGFLLVVFFGFYFFNIAAKTERLEKPTEQNLVNGRLAFTSRIVGPAPPEGRIITSNPDGTGQTGLGIPVSLNPTEPAWSPDGTKIAFASTSSGPDLYAINADGIGQTPLTNTPEAERNPSWSVLGKIAYERSSQIWVMNADGSGQAQFSAITQPLPTGPAWSPDGTKLAFASSDEIWVINADGANERRVTINLTPDTDPAWSPDGAKIVFAKGGSGISVINADGTNETPLTNVGGDMQPAWSPDGTKIAFRRGTATRGILTMDANGANQVRIVADVINFPQCCDVLYENPAWQPVVQPPSTFVVSGRVTYNNLPVIGVTVNLSGTINAAATTDTVGNYQFSGLPSGGNYTVSPSFVRYYFTPPNRSFNNLNANQTGDFEVLGVCQNGNCVKNGKIAFKRSGDIFTINSDGTNQTNITNNAAADDAPNYSPDGSLIVFTSNRDGNNEIYRMNADGSNPLRLTNDAASDFSPYYSPDGATIVFVSTRDGNSEIYKMNADGTNQVRLTNNTSSDTEPAFSPGGQKIVYVSSTAGPIKLFTMNADGSNPQSIPDSFGFAPSYERPSYSPDGTKIIFTYTSDSGFEVRVTWTMNVDGTNRVRFPADGSYGTYSPDGTQVAYTCCIIDNTNRLRTSDKLGSSGSLKILTPSNIGNGLPDWQSLRAPRPTQFDFDGDERSDVSVFRPSDGTWYLLRSTAGFSAQPWGISTDVLVPGDYDGDLKTDVAVWRPSNGNFYILNSFNNTFRYENFGLPGDIPTGGDWDGDGKADVAVFREGGPQQGFHYRGSMGNPNGNVSTIPWGVPGDKPVAGDYDGDGRTDAAVFRNGTWYIRQSSNGQLSASNFGQAGDVLVPADYDADGKTDLAVYRGGIWYLLRSAQGFTAFQFGISNDIPAPADYDGDGRADAAIFRNGVWWILKTQSATAETISFGSSGDAPVPSAFVR